MAKYTSKEGKQYEDVWDPRIGQSGQTYQREIATGKTGFFYAETTNDQGGVIGENFSEMTVAEIARSRRSSGGGFFDDVKEQAQSFAGGAAQSTGLSTAKQVLEGDKWTPGEDAWDIVDRTAKFVESGVTRAGNAMGADKFLTQMGQNLQGALDDLTGAKRRREAEAEARAAISAEEARRAQQQADENARRARLDVAASQQAGLLQQQVSQQTQSSLGIGGGYGQDYLTKDFLGLA